MIKTTSNRFDDVATLVRALSKYQCPEIISCRVTQGTPDYLDWIVTETTDAG
jgi:uncharacterized protein involved in tolerance to divalent cations